MKTRLLLLVLICSVAAPGLALAQSSGGKSGDRKDSAPKSAGDLAVADFYKLRNDAKAKQDQAQFQKVIAAGLTVLEQYPTHAAAVSVVTDLGNYPSFRLADKTSAPLRPVFVSRLQYEVTTARYKEGVSDEAKVALVALIASAAEAEARTSPNKQTLETLREKIDALAQLPGSGRFLAPRELGYAQLLGSRGQAHLQSLTEHPEKPVADMARQELLLLDARTTPFGLKFTALDGSEVDFAKLRGKVVAMYFWSTTNGNSTRAFDALKDLYSEYKKPGLEIVTVSFDKDVDREKVAKFVKDNRLPWPVYFDGQGAQNEFAPKLNVTRVPHLAVFDQKGMLIGNNVQLAMLEPGIRQAFGMKPKVVAPPEETSMPSSRKRR
jgi:peroxiredoxin